MKRNDASLFNTAFGNRYFVMAVSVSVMLILMGLLLDRVNREFEQAESTHFEHRLAELKAAVRLMEAELISQGELEFANKFDGANPMDWLADDASHYLGLVSPYKAVEYPGNWFFDPIKQEIAYVPAGLKKEQGALSLDERLEKILRFKVLALRSREINSKFTGLTLETISSP